MNLTEGIKQSFEVISSNKVRAFLTMLGMNFGVGSLVAIAIVGLGFRQSINKEMGRYGSTLVWVQSNRKAYTDFERRIYLSDQDVAYFVNSVKGLESHSTQFKKTAQVSYKSREKRVLLQGVSPDYFNIFAIDIESGRTFLPLDIKLHRKICVLRPDIAENLFNGENPLGKRLKIDGQLFTVAGLTEKLEKSILNDGSDNDTIFVPSDYLAGKIWQGNSKKHWVYLMKFDTVANVDIAIDRYKNYLEKKYGLLRGKERFLVQKFDSFIKLADKILNIVSSIILVIASVSLLVGGLGIMNIMLVTVTERTREIGVRMAIGASRADILAQFIIEAVIICLIGGGIGIIFGLVLSGIACNILKWAYIINAVYVTGALLISILIGLVFGIYPAFKASKLTPIEALRVEY